MIAAVILDVDGVIIGSKPDFNLPHPHPSIVAALKRIKANGIPISLCTAKPCFAIEKIINDAQLDNPHIAYAGGVIFNPLSSQIIKNTVLDSRIASQMIEQSLKQGFYTEFLTLSDDFIQENNIVAGSLAIRTSILLKKPVIVKDLAQKALSEKINNFTIAINQPGQKSAVDSLFSFFEERLTLVWTIHPFTPGWEYAIITAKGISKRTAAQELAQALNIPLANALGVGDSMADWEFIEQCGYKAAVGNAHQDLKNLITASDPLYSYIGPSVDENGLLDIFKHFNLSSES